MKNVSKLVGSIGFFIVCMNQALAVCDTTKVINIEIRDMKYSPEHVEICAGQTVVWTNKEPADAAEPMSHTVTADPTRANKPENFALPEGATPFHSKGIKPGMTFQYTFITLGDYKYFCVPHQDHGHIGTLTVVADQVDPAADQE